MGEKDMKPSMNGLWLRVHMCRIAVLVLVPVPVLALALALVLMLRAKSISGVAVHVLRLTGCGCRRCICSRQVKISARVLLELKVMVAAFQRESSRRPELRISVSLAVPFAWHVRLPCIARSKPQFVLCSRSCIAGIASYCCGVVFSFLTRQTGPWLKVKTAASHSS